MPTLPPGVRPIDMTQQAARISGQADPAPSLRQRLSAAWAALNGRPFGPGQPAEPSLPPETPPRQFVYPQGVNLQRQPRREYPKLTPFEQLRNLAELYDVAAMCIAARVEELQGLDHSVAAKDKKQQAAYQDVCDEAAEFWEKPDKVNDFDTWIGMSLYDLFTIDAMTLYRHPDMAGRLHSLEPVDGATIMPLLDPRGRTQGYQQVINGIVETDYGLTDLLYKPRWRRTYSPYGSPPTEWVIMRVNQALRKQSFDLAWFTDGNIPDMLATAPEGNMNPDQMRTFEEWFNAVLEGDDAARRKVRFIPWAMNFHIAKEFSYETALDEWMLRVTCAAYAVPPQELGFTEDVNRATAEMQEAVNERRGLKPLATWLKKNLFDRVMHDDFGAMLPDRTVSLPGQPTRAPINPFKHVEWQWHFGDSADEAVQASSDTAYITSGVLSPDEVRTMRFGDVVDGPAPGIPAAQQPGFGAPGFYASPDGSQTQPQYPNGRPFPPLPAGRPQSTQLNQAARDLKLWREKATKAARGSKSPAVAFVSENIPAGLHSQISQGLSKAVTVDDVRQVFEQAAEEVAAASPFPWGKPIPFLSAHDLDWGQYG